MGGGEVGRLLTVDEVAEALRLSPSAVYGLAHSDGLPATRIGRSILVSGEGLANYLWAGERERVSRLRELLGSRPAEAALGRHAGRSRMGPDRQAPGVLFPGGGPPRPSACAAPQRGVVRASW